MIVLTAFALIVAPAEPSSTPVQRVAAERQALALVRILPGAPIRFSDLEQSAPESFRDSEIRNADGSVQSARLVEFQ